jgi:hypothetical protein
MLVVPGGDVAGAAIITAREDLIDPIQMGFLLGFALARCERTIRWADVDLNVTAFREVDRFGRAKNALFANGADGGRRRTLIAATSNCSGAILSRQNACC